MLNDPHSDKPAMKIGEVAERLGTTPRTLRFYDQEGLIRPRRSEKGTRHYGEDDIERLQAILLLSQLGMPIEKIRQLASVRPESRNGDESSRHVTSILEELRRDTEAKLIQYRWLLADIKVTKRLVRRCFSCAKRPDRRNCDSCPIGEALPDSLLLKLVWDQIDAPPA